MKRGLIVSWNFWCLDTDCSIKKMITIECTEEESDHISCIECSCKLKKVGQAAFSFGTPKKEQRQKTIAHLKQRSKNHAQSDEAKEQKRKVEIKEMGNMGYEVAKKKRKRVKRKK